VDAGVDVETEKNQQAPVKTFGVILSEARDLLFVKKLRKEEMNWVSEERRFPENWREEQNRFKSC
jgi:hypothetical protein